jgi:Cu(I)/Ag(I) efflux system membrane fusion protein
MKRILVIIVLIVVAFAMGLLIRGDGTKTGVSRNHDEHTITETKTQVWTCSMHPQIRASEPGKCPICGMDLIPVTSDNDEGLGERELKLSQAAIKLAEIQTSEVERKHVSVEVRLVGKLEYDETRLGHITAWVPGRIDRLFVDYTGISVKKGDHMVSLYSPELLTAQEELLQALKAVAEFKNTGMRIMRENTQQTLEASREKLRLWGLTEGQISMIENNGKANDHVTIYAPMGGVVINKNVEQGAYVNTGTRLYTIADLSRLWIKMDAYESDLLWLRYGQEVSIETEAYPGESFKGTIAFIDPMLNNRTRTVKVRANIDNSNGKLKPEMFVRASIKARVAAAGKVMDEALAGKWICPMHPDVIKGEAGSCDICGMPLVRTESLGYASVPGDKEQQAPLVIPASAPLITGKRAVVYIADPMKEGVFEGREIMLGPRAGDYYIVTEGLNKGEQVVTNGNFKIDSALQIQAKPSMMSPDGGVMPAGHAHYLDATNAEKSLKTEKKHNEHQDHQTSVNKTDIEDVNTPLAFREDIDNVLTVYFKIQEALSQDSAEDVMKNGKNLQEALKEVDMKLLSGEAHMDWMKELEVLNKQARALEGNMDINEQREAFHLLSESLISVVKQFGTSGSQSVLQFHCPMAFDGKGADWLQNQENIQNPYFGEKMPECGEQTAILISLKTEM